MSAEEVKALTKNYHELQHDVNALRQDFSNVQKSLQRIEENIEQALFGNEKIMHDGVIKKLHNNEQNIEALSELVRGIREEKALADAKFKKDKYWITGIASAIGGGLVWLINFITK